MITLNLTSDECDELIRGLERLWLSYSDVVEEDRIYVTRYNEELQALKDKIKEGIKNETKED